VSLLSFFLSGKCEFIEFIPQRIRLIRKEENPRNSLFFRSKINKKCEFIEFIPQRIRLIR
jgi:hypothetical protein